MSGREGVKAAKVSAAKMSGTFSLTFSGRFQIWFDCGSLHRSVPPLRTAAFDELPPCLKRRGLPSPQVGDDAGDVVAVGLGKFVPHRPDFINDVAFHQEDPFMSCSGVQIAAEVYPPSRQTS